MWPTCTNSTNCTELAESRESRFVSPIFKFQMTLPYIKANPENF